MSKFYIDTESIENLSLVLTYCSDKISDVSRIPFTISTQLQMCMQFGYNLSEIKNRLYTASSNIASLCRDIELLADGLKYVVNESNTKDSMIVSLLSDNPESILSDDNIIINRDLASDITTLNSPSFVNDSSTPSSSTPSEWLGHDLHDDNHGVTAWLGKASAETQNEWSYADVNAYLGKVKTEAKTDFDFMKTENKTEYKNDEWGDKSTTTFIAAEATVSTSISAIAIDADAGIGNDMLGIEGKAEGAVGNATAEAKGKFSVGEDGLNAYAKGEAMVSAVEGKAEGTINILGIEITGKVGGYAGAVGVEGKVGVENNKFVLEGGAAALIGGSVGIEIGFNDEGWDNFIDYIVFWD